MRVWSGVQYVTRAVRVVDLITNLDMQTFQQYGGMTAFINRLQVSQSRTAARLNWLVLVHFSLVYLTLPLGWTGFYTCPALRPYQLGPMRIPECNQKVTGGGHKAVVSSEAKTSTRALVTCSNLPTRIWSALSCSSPPDFRNFSGRWCNAPPPRQGGWPRWGSLVSLYTFSEVSPLRKPGEKRWVFGRALISNGETE